MTPPCNVLKMSFFIFYVITLYFVLLKFCLASEGTQGPPYVCVCACMHTYMRIYIHMHVCIPFMNACMYIP